MIRGTTPTHTFTLPFETELIKELRISYKQCDEVIVEKNESDCTLTGKEITVKLTQEDTLKFNHERIVRIQLKALLLDGNVLASDIIRRGIGEVLNDEVLV